MPKKEFLTIGRAQTQWRRAEGIVAGRALHNVRLRPGISDKIKNPEYPSPRLRFGLAELDLSRQLRNPNPLFDLLLLGTGEFCARVEALAL